MHIQINSTEEKEVLRTLIRQLKVLVNKPRWCLRDSYVDIDVPLPELIETTDTATGYREFLQMPTNPRTAHINLTIDWWE